MLLPITLRAWLAVSLLVIVSSFEVIKVIHVDHHHDAEITVCTENNETDACHRSIVHFDAEAGCAHTQHLEKVVADCEICDALITTYLFEATEDLSTSRLYARTEEKQTALDKPYTAFLAFAFLRGPPVLS